ncbi:unnamed protein product [Pleuronectes platessa]|uniref:Uncharacterized protein n=1 Tax=Pleuronectes platessa TaxID=8262 RepID=A0A9N7UTE9_PLEPL|nr:unnamed protein product [Pleuronectes platessa]
MPFPAAQPPQREARPGAQLARLGGASRQAHGAQPAQGPLPPQTCPGRDDGMRDQEGKMGGRGGGEWRGEVVPAEAVQRVPAERCLEWPFHMMTAGQAAAAAGQFVA